jgi:hypothetical protein
MTYDNNKVLNYVKQHSLVNKQLEEEKQLFFDSSRIKEEIRTIIKEYFAHTPIFGDKRVIQSASYYDDDLPNIINLLNYVKCEDHSFMDNWGLENDDYDAKKDFYNDKLQYVFKNKIGLDVLNFFYEDIKNYVFDYDLLNDYVTNDYLKDMMIHVDDYAYYKIGIKISIENMNLYTSYKDYLKDFCRVGKINHLAYKTIGDKNMRAVYKNVQKLNNLDCNYELDNAYLYGEFSFKNWFFNDAFGSQLVCFDKLCFLSSGDTYTNLENVDVKSIDVKVNSKLLNDNLEVLCFNTRDYHFFDIKSFIKCQVLDIC